MQNNSSQNFDPQTIHAYSFDFDGCLYTQNYLDCHKDVVRANQQLMDHVKEKAEQNGAIVMVGSNRQSRDIDVFNNIDKRLKSCFKSIEQIAHHTGAKLEKTLMADIENDLPLGTAFDEAIEAENNKTNNGYVSDEGEGHYRVTDQEFEKFVMLYVQMHKLAMDYPEQNVQFYFYDDAPMILEQSCKAFTNNTSLVPANVTIHFQHYLGNETPINQNYGHVVGTGQKDKLYREHAKLMMQYTNHKGIYDALSRKLSPVRAQAYQLINDDQPIIDYFKERYLARDSYQQLQPLFDSIQEHPEGALKHRLLLTMANYASKSPKKLVKELDHTIKDCCQTMNSDSSSDEVEKTQALEQVEQGMRELCPQYYESASHSQGSTVERDHTSEEASPAPRRGIMSSVFSFFANAIDAVATNPSSSLNPSDPSSNPSNRS